MTISGRVRGTRKTERARGPRNVENLWGGRGTEKIEEQGVYCDKSLYCLLPKS
jgi:hypothetical protein